VCKPSNGLQATDRGVTEKDAMGESLKSDGFIQNMKKSYVSQMAEKQKKEAKLKEEQLIYDRARKEKIEYFNLKYDKKRISHYIPCMHIPFHIGASKVMLYFHANAEDIVLAHELLDYIRTLLRIHIIAIEYPGYGLYTDDL